MGTFDGEGYYVKDVLIIAHGNASGVVLKKLVALLNSTVLRFYYETSFPTLHVQRNELASLPIKTVILEEKGSKGIDKLVDRILAAKAADLAARLRRARRGRQADTSAWEREIDERVYKLYLPAPLACLPCRHRQASRQAGGLTAEEIQIVERAAQGKGGGE